MIMGYSIHEHLFLPGYRIFLGAGVGGLNYVFIVTAIYPLKKNNLNKIKYGVYIN